MKSVYLMLMRRFRFSLLTLLVFAAAFSVLGGCEQPEPEQSEPSATHSVDDGTLAITTGALSSDSTDFTLPVTQLSLVFARSTGETLTQTIPWSGAKPTSSSVSLRAGNWTLSGSAQDGSGEVIATGSTPFLISKGKTTQIVLQLTKTAVSQTGSGKVQIQINAPPEVSALVVTPDELYAGDSLWVSATVTDDVLAAPEVMVTFGVVTIPMVPSASGTFVAQFFAPEIPGIYDVVVAAFDAQGASSSSSVPVVVMAGASLDPDHDGDGVAGSMDCDDFDLSVFPGAPEICNGFDDNCDGIADENCAPTLPRLTLAGFQQTLQTPSQWMIPLVDPLSGAPDMAVISDPFVQQQIGAQILFNTCEPGHLTQADMYRIQISKQSGPAGYVTVSTWGDPEQTTLFIQFADVFCKADSQAGGQITEVTGGKVTGKKEKIGGSGTTVAADATTTVEDTSANCEKFESITVYVYNDSPGDSWNAEYAKARAKATGGVAIASTGPNSIRNALQQLKNQWKLVSKIVFMVHGNSALVALSSGGADGTYVGYGEGEMTPEEFGEMLKPFLTDPAEIILGSCNTADTDEGKDFIQDLADASGASVTASDGTVSVDGDEASTNDSTSEGAGEGDLWKATPGGDAPEKVQDGPVDNWTP
ncbi:MAG: DUF4347 domain-containing protein [Myxococcales bacterium]|nr:DUF4347 domain-containing protein [Myxococcales bacterium]